MDAALVERWNEVVAPNDVVWVLGDIALDYRRLDPIKELNGLKLLVAGNHDACWTGHRKQAKARKSLPAYQEAGFEQVHDSGVVHGHRIAGIDVVLSHLPYAGDHEPTDRYADRRPPDRGLPMLCGHVHNAWRTNGRMINVGVDVWDSSRSPRSLIFLRHCARPPAAGRRSPPSSHAVPAPSRAPTTAATTR